MEWLSDWLLANYPKTLQLLRELGPIVVAGVAAFIAWKIQRRQWETADLQRRIAHDKLKLDMLNHRMKILDGVGIVHQIRGLSEPNIEKEMQFVRAIVESKFIFPFEVHSKAEEILSLFGKLKSYERSNAYVRSEELYGELNTKLLAAVDKFYQIAHESMKIDRTL